ncbi:alpha/beta fold hydrolase [Providencia stuartii]|uniref:alpha/beta fold hydrolase n=1 Tax=Providencia stuartii TaxID=588 RepID=UPI0018C5139F|nr:alpha/beta hydrolase [Providencia stuartii]MBG5920110.1 alpha/beta hydrolase [Providencia stuartii]
MITNAETVLFYDSFGIPKNPAVVLIPGLGGHNISWTDDFCQQVADAGFYILRIDNRDAGLSPHLDNFPSINLGALIEKMQNKEQFAIPYTLLDMAEDIVQLLNKLSINKAHIIGRSMGGMIAQLVAAKYPERTLSLCAIMSSTGNPELPQSEPDVMQMLISPSANPQENLDAYLSGQLAFFQRVSSSICPFDENYYRDYLLQALKRNYSPEGTKRQIVAVAVTGDLRPYIQHIDTPTLVIHGSIDPLFPLAAGQDIANNIANAKLVIIEGMGHETPPLLNSKIADLIIAHLHEATN